MINKIFLYVCIVVSLALGGSCGKVDDTPLPDDDENVIKRDVPVNEGVKIAYKKAHQFTGIKWIPVDSLPSTESRGVFTSGKQYTGLWYSSVRQTNKYIGMDVSMRTAMTALHNPYSLLYTENISAKKSRSAYGMTYNGSNCGAYMGIVCTSLVGYALGFDFPWGSAQYPYLAEKGFFETVKGNNVQSLKLMDILHEDGHASLITDIWRNKKGEIVKLEISESVAPVAKSEIYTAAEAQERFNKDKFRAFYRYKDISKNTHYEPSVFVPLEGETAQSYKYNDDICTFAGDYAVFGSEDIIVINYTKGAYTHMEIYDQRGLLHTLELAAGADVHNMDITSLSLPGGYYKARLVSDGKSSDYTYFSVVNYDIKTTGNKTALTVDFSAEGGTPRHIKITRDSNIIVCFYMFTQQDKTSGNTTIDIEKLRLIKRNDPNEELYLQVAFATEYGVAYSHPIKIQ